MNKRKLLIVAILIFTISLIVGSTYAYFSITKDQGTNTVEVGAKTLALNFSDGPTINTSDLLPGATIVKTFSVENTGTDSVFYGLYLGDVTNTFTRTEDITYTLSSTNNGGIISQTVYPNSDGTLIEYIVIPKDTIQEYTLTITYENKIIDQSVDMGKTITGTVTLVDSEEAYNLAGIAFDEDNNLLTSGYVEVHSKVITAPINSDGTYLLENVPVGEHEILFKDTEDNTLIEDNFTLVSNHEERVNEKTIVGATNKTIAIEVALNSDSVEEIKTQSTLHTVDLIINHGFSNGLSYGVYDGRNKSISVTPETDYSYDDNTGSSLVCTNNQTATYENNILNIDNVTDNTVCTITFSTIQYTLMATTDNDKTKFRSDTYKQKIKNITIRNGINVPNNAIESWDISVEQNNGIIAYVVNNTTAGYYDLFIESNSTIKANEDMSNWFANLKYVDSINGINLIDVSNTKNMRNMFCYAGYYSTIIALDLGNNFNTSNVTNMSSIFDSTGYNSVNFTLDLGGKFDTSNVTNMSGMFRYSGFKNTDFSLDLGNKFDTSNVMNMSFMFDSTGYRSTNFALNLGDKFDTSNVTNMYGMFSFTGHQSTNFSLDLGDKFDMSNVTNMNYMFSCAGYSNSSFNLTLNLTNKNITDYSNMFSNAAYSSTTGGITVNYSSSVSSKIDQLIATKDQGKVYKGSLIQQE